MTFGITYCDEYERIIQAVLIDSRVAGLQNGNVYRADIDAYLNALDDTDMTYKIETDQGVLVGFFVYNTVSGVVQQSFRRPFAEYTTLLQQEIGNFIASGNWIFETLDGSNVDEIVYEFSEYNTEDYLVQRYSFVWMDEVERVVQAVAIAAGSVTQYANGNVVRTDIDTLLQNVADYDIAYKIENQQGVLVGFFAYNVETAATLTVIRNPYKQYDTQIDSAVSQFITSNKWEFDFLNQPVYIQRAAYNVTDYNPNDYLVQMYSFVQLEFTERVVQAVLIDGKTNFLTLNANGNVIRAELDDFMLQLEGYRVTYKIENQQGVLVGFFGSDPCIDGYLVAVRRPFLSYLTAINQAVDKFVTSGVWRFDLLNIEPCPPTDLPCYFTINDCYMTINGCYATIEPKKKFVQRYF